jgi:hypothetical protein
MTLGTRRRLRLFGSIGAVNPTLTIIANAPRVGEHLSGRLT